MLIDADFICAYCGSLNPTTVDPSAGADQTYVEDCQTCCRPNLLEVHIDQAGPTAVIDASPEND